MIVPSLQLYCLPIGCHLGIQVRLFFLALFVLPSSAGTLSFNRDIRPILSDRCFACHGPDAASRKSKLRLDQEGASRQAIVPGDAEQSELYKRITSPSQIKRMPPAYLGHKALSPEEIAKLKQWIAEGAHYESHWAFAPPQRPQVPAGRNAIDFLVRKRLEREGLSLSPPAAPNTLLRRVTFDLTGLPPTPQETASFLANPASYGATIDRLLASPRYAERMTIRWLEAARYADSNGYQSDGPRDMYRYRDWVLDAFRANMPFDQFTIEQLAGDLLPNPTLSQRIATAFHRNHSTSAEGGIVDEEFRVQYVADRAETTSTVFLGLTAGCARCHDHKYDPIRQKDFYQLFAFFNNVPEKGFVYDFGNEEPYIRAPYPDQQAKLDEFDRRLAASRSHLAALTPAADQAFARWRRRLPAENWTVTDGLQFHAPQAQSFDGRREASYGNETAQFSFHDPYTFSAWIRPESPDGAILSRGQDYFEGQGHFLHLMQGKLRFHATYRWSDLAMRLETVDPLPLGRWQHVAVSYDGSMHASNVSIYVNGIKQKVRILFDQPIWPFDTKEPFRIGAGGGRRFQGEIRDVRVYTRVLSGAETAVLAGQNEDGRLRMWFDELYAPPAWRQARSALNALAAERAAYFAKIPTVMVMVESDTPRQAYILRRGAYDAHGEEVQPNVPAFLPPLPAGAPRNRLALARWLVSKDNPLTARVTVNRLWQMLFGTGLVKTVEDFGAQGEPPIHVELLDWLAVEFMESGWDIHHILKTIVTSETYRQSSAVSPSLQQRDPENRLLARGPRVRLAPEMIRDQALAVSGLLVEKLGGPSVKPYQPAGLWQELSSSKGYVQDSGEGLYRRTLYSYWKRTVAPPSMITFDSPTRETCVVRESRTNTPLQALALMNDVTYLEASRKLAERLLRQESQRDSARLELAFGIVLARKPTPAEAKLFSAALARFAAYYQQHPEDAVQYLSAGESPRDTSVPTADLAAWTAVSSLLLNLDEAITKE
ncbi:MAG: DUF1553 domain-containing protein [Acidobacteria bacterium]|nr:DUF1553 domain-containing protein [Acidobacteriota bacterium]